MIVDMVLVGKCVIPTCNWEMTVRDTYSIRENINMHEDSNKGHYVYVDISTIRGVR